MKDRVWGLSYPKVIRALSIMIMVLILVPFNLLMANPTLLKDIDKSGSSGASSYLLFNGSVYFIAYDYIHGGELWRSDPPFENATMVKDIFPGENSSEIEFLGIMNNAIYLRAKYVGYRKALWKSDGTAVGTKLLKARGPLNERLPEEVVPEKKNSRSEYNQYEDYIFLNDKLYFSDNGNGIGWELWVTDGTQDGTVLVKDINPGQGGSFSRYFAGFNNEVYFQAHTETNGFELWKSDGTSNGTVLVKDILMGKNGGSPFNFLVFQNHLYFSAWDSMKGREIWKSDGTTNGTTRLKDIFTGPKGHNPSHYNSEPFIIFKDRFIFAAEDSTSGYELWASDGTETGTVLIKDIRQGREGSRPSNFTILNNMLFFTASDGINGNELWTSDGTPGGTVLLKNINGTKNSSFGLKCSIYPWRDALYFFADDGISGNELWRSDGTDIGTAMVIDINGNDSDSIDRTFDELIFFTENAFYFAANDGVYGKELWKSDGTKDGTTLVKDIFEGSYGNFKVKDEYFCEISDNQIIFGASDGVHGYEPWVSDGTENGTRLISDLTTARIMDWKGPSLFRKMDERFYFFYEMPQLRFALWKSDGSDAGTSMVKDIPFAGYEVFSVEMAIVFNDLLYFVAEDYSRHGELWKSDGSEAGTQLVKKINHIASPPNSRWVNTFLVSGQYLYLSVNDYTHGYELWRSDGTKDGTVLVKDINGGDKNSDSYPDHFTDINGVLYFTADDGKHGVELWRSDGSLEGTVMVKDINPLEGSSLSIGRLTEMAGILYFIADDGLHGDELWKSDGTKEGTQMVRDIHLGKASGLSRELMPELTVSGGVLYFSANNGPHNYELWRSDGTTEGTWLVKDISSEDLYDPNQKESGLESFLPSNLTDVNGTLYFTAYESFYDKGLWKSDGTEEGTVLVKNLIPRRHRSYMYLFTNGNGVLYFREKSKEEGVELWKSDGTPSGTHLVFDLYEGKKSSLPRKLTVIDDTLYFAADHPMVGTEVWKLDLNARKNITGNAKSEGESKGCFIQTLFIGR